MEILESAPHDARSHPSELATATIAPARAYSHTRAFDLAVPLYARARWRWTSARKMDHEPPRCRRTKLVGRTNVDSPGSARMFRCRMSNRPRLSPRSAGSGRTPRRALLVTAWRPGPGPRERSGDASLEVALPQLRKVSAEMGGWAKWIRDGRIVDGEGVVASTGGLSRAGSPSSIHACRSGRLAAAAHSPPGRRAEATPGWAELPRRRARTPRSRAAARRVCVKM